MTEVTHPIGDLPLAGSTSGTSGTSGASTSPPVPAEGSGGRLVRTARRVLPTGLYVGARSVVRLARGKELSAPFPLSYKLRWWWHGFRADSALVYDLPRNDWRDFVSDYMRYYRNININTAKQFFDNKPLFRSFLLANGFRQAQTIALIGRRGNILMHPFDRDARPATAQELERWLIGDGGRFFAKPEGGTYGHGIFFLEVRDGVLIRRRGTETRPFRSGEWRRSLIIERCVEQGAFERSLYPDSSNTIRALTMWAPGDRYPFIARAVQRAGTADTMPTDNFAGGGVSAMIDLETGRLGVGRIHPVKGKRAVRECTHHPDSGTRIEGAVVPHWDRVRDTVLRAAATLPTNPYVGWDVLVDETGTPVIIEGNGNSGFGALQVHGGLLADPAARRFYERVGAL